MNLYELYTFNNIIDDLQSLAIPVLGFMTPLLLLCIGKIKRLTWGLYGIMFFSIVLIIGSYTLDISENKRMAFNKMLIEKGVSYSAKTHACNFSNFESLKRAFHEDDTITIIESGFLSKIKRNIEQKEKEGITPLIIKSSTCPSLSLWIEENNR
ncbi:MAG: hypothetical protein HOG49_13060 [Candidatus Scalindua sp.]|nr:hypothetical protein [Candidatus Scalindua sp.]